MLYELESPDGIVYDYTFNIIIYNLIDQADDQGWDTVILEEIVAFRRNPDVAIPKREQAYTSVNKIQIPVITTKGCFVPVKFIDQSTAWFPLHLIK